MGTNSVRERGTRRTPSPCRVVRGDLAPPDQRRRALDGAVDRRARCGGERLDEFSAVVLGHSSSLRRVIRSWGASPASIDDHLQEVFLRAWRSWWRFDSAQPPWPWLLRIARNEYFDSCRRAHVRPQALSASLLDGDMPEVAGPTSDRPEDDWLATERGALLVEVLGQLPPRQREALAVTALEGASYARAAAQFGISQSALKALVFRARLQARRIYDAMPERRALRESRELPA